MCCPNVKFEIIKNEIKALAYKRNCEIKRERIPLHTEKPIMGLKTNKNFIISNAVENILARSLFYFLLIFGNVAAKVQKEDVRYVEKKDFGRVPTYLQTIKQNIQNEYDMI